MACERLQVGRAQLARIDRPTVAQRLGRVGGRGALAREVARDRRDAARRPARRGALRRAGAARRGSSPNAVSSRAARSRTPRSASGASAPRTPARRSTVAGARAPGSRASAALVCSGGGVCDRAAGRSSATTAMTSGGGPAVAARRRARSRGRGVRACSGRLHVAPRRRAHDRRPSARLRSAVTTPGDDGAGAAEASTREQLGRRACSTRQPERDARLGRRRERPRLGVVAAPRQAPLAQRQRRDRRRRRPCARRDHRASLPARRCPAPSS